MGTALTEVLCIAIGDVIVLTNLLFGESAQLEPHLPDILTLHLTQLFCFFTPPPPRRADACVYACSEMMARSCACVVSIKTGLIRRFSLVPPTVRSSLD